MKIIFQSVVVFFFLFSTPCVAKLVKSSSEFPQLLHQKSSLVGRAVNEKFGAMVIGPDFSVWIDGMLEWPLFFGGSALEVASEVFVEGVLIERNDLPFGTSADSGLAEQGITPSPGLDSKQAGHRYLLTNITWQPMLNSEIRISPNYDGGKPAGMKVLSLRPNTFWAKLGVQKGDVLIKVEGKDLTIQNGLALICPVYPRESYTVDVLRNGTTIQLVAK